MIEEVESKNNLSKTLLIILITVVLTIIIYTLIVGACIWYKDMFGLRTLAFKGIFCQSMNLNDPNMLPGSNTNYDHLLLTPEQEQIVESYGLDPSLIPEEIPADLEKCAVERLGEKRVNEIIDGDVPSMLEILKAKECF